MEITFQSTLPRRSDSPKGPDQKWTRDFNPRSREGATTVIQNQSGVQKYFNPRSREGATEMKRKMANIRKFQSTLPRRSDYFPQVINLFLGISIHAPAKERQLLRSVIRAGVQFQSTLPRRSDMTSSRLLRSGLYFNPRSREGATSSPFPCQSA